MRGGVGVRRAAVVVGRDDELDQLLRAVRGTATEPGSCILLLGEGGVGKTRLVGEAATAARQLGLGVLIGRAPITTPVAFSVVAEALRSWLRGHPVAAMPPFDRGLRLILPEWDAPHDASAELSGAQLRLLALEGLVRLLREIAATNGGAVVFLDDLHAADAESLEAIRYLATAAIAGTVVVGALRPGESPVTDEFVRALRRDGVADVVELEALDARAVAALVAAVLDADPPDALVADIMARTDGVPLLVEEVLDAYVHGGSVEVGAAGAVWRGGTVVVPRNVREMVESRLARMPRAHREALVAGAVVGDFDPMLTGVVAAADAGAVSDALSDGIRVGLLETTGGTIAFRHDVIREAVLDATVPHQVDLMHRRAAAALAEVPSPNASVLERRAGHLMSVGEDDDAAALLVAAANASVAEHALLGGERLARTARELSRSAAIRSDAADALAGALAAQGRWSEALDVDETTVAEHGETPARRHRMATSAIEAGRPELAGPIIARAIEAGDTSPFIYIAAGRVALVTGDAGRALEYSERVLDGPARDDLDARLSALELRGRASDYLGARDEAEAAWTQQAEEARAAGKTQAELRAVVQLGKVELFAGRRPNRVAEAVELARAAGALLELAWAEENLAVALGLHGDLPGSLAVLDDAIARCRELHLDQLAYLLAQRAILTSYLTEPDGDPFAEAEELAPTPDLLLHTTSMRGDIALRQGRYDDAVHWFDAADEIMRTMPGAVPLDAPCWQVWALAAAGRPDDAAAQLETARALPDLARWYARPVVVAAGAALLAGDEAGVDNAIAATDAHMPVDVALMRMLGAEIMQGPSRVRWLREALDTYETCGASMAADRARRLLRDAGGKVPRRRRASHAATEELAARGVTAREEEVLKLLGDGLSNAEIAERLYLSVRTVEGYVSSLLVKLDARTRGQLTALSASIPYDT